MDMSELYLVEQQEAIETKYNRKHIDKQIRKELLICPVIQEKIEQGVELLFQWMDKDYYQSKQDRIDQLKGLDLKELVENIYVGIGYFIRPETFVSATTQLAGRIGFNDKKEAIQTMAEILAVLCVTDVFDIYKEDKGASLMLLSRIKLSEELIEFIENSEYLPPMICRPKELESNYDSGYLTHKESLVLGKNNHHSGDLCLDVLNTVNSVALKLDTQFLSTVEEIPTYELDDLEKKDLWLRFKKQSHHFYKLMIRAGNQFYLTHRVDKRGRIYASGYHITTMGTAYKKASIELYKEEKIDVPAEYRI